MSLPNTGGEGMIDEVDPKIQLRAEKYRRLLFEIKCRVNFLRFLVKNKSQFGDMLAYEISYLQLRMICESVALGLLVLHGDIVPWTKEIEKRYEADKIMRLLENLHRDFFPAPIDKNDLIEAGPDGRPIHVWQPRSNSYLTKTDLIRIYRECGSNLHRGSIRRLFDREFSIDFDKIVSYVNDIMNLTERHSITPADGEYLYYCIMEDGSGNARVQIFKKHT